MEEQLNAKVDSWRLEQNKWMPSIRYILEKKDEDDHDTPFLHLPSDFSAAERTDLCLTELASVEMSLREGQAFDILDELRQQIKVNAMLQIDKEENVWGTRASTRSFKAINEAHRLKRHWMSEYRAVRDAMVSLGLDKDSCFKELTDKDLYPQINHCCTYTWHGTKPDGWIWAMGKGSGSKGIELLDEG